MFTIPDPDEQHLLGYGMMAGFNSFANLGLNIRILWGNLFTTKLDTVG